jgi:hypothetical protein
MTCAWFSLPCRVPQLAAAARCLASSSSKLGCAWLSILRRWRIDGRKARQIAGIWNAMSTSAADTELIRIYWLLTMRRLA